MKLKIRKRTYRMKDADLTQTSDDIVDSAERDAAELVAYGITPVEITAIKAARDAFADMPSDNNFMADMMIATETKNATREQLHIAARQITGRAKIKFGDKSGKYRKFDTDDMSQLSDNDFVRAIRGVELAATEFLTELDSTGLTQTMIDDLLALRILFDDQVDAQKSAIKARDIAVDERIRLGNELYALLVTLADTGKLCWESVNEAKYNDYVIYKTSSSTTPQFEVDGSVDAGSVVSTSVTGITPETTLILRNTSTAVLDFFFAENPTDTTGTNVATVPANSEQTLTALQLGYNEAADIIRLNVFNQSAIAGSYEIEWS